MILESVAVAPLKSPRCSNLAADFNVSVSSLGIAHYRRLCGFVEEPQLLVAVVQPYTERSRADYTPALVPIPKQTGRRHRRLTPLAG